MSRKNLFTLVAILIIASLFAVGCGPTATNNDGNTANTTTYTTEITINGNNSGDIVVAQGNSYEESNTTNAAAPAATEAPAPAPTEAPAVETDSDVCFYTAWHDGWQKGPERINTDGVLSREALEEGMSMQASWEKWTSTTKVDGFTIPEGFEPNNDGLQAVVCGNDAYMPDRIGSSEMPFWFISYIQLTSDGLLICKDDTGTPGNWDGECAGTKTVVEAIPLDEISVPGDFQQNWTSLMDLMNSWSGNTPTHGTIENAWTTTK